MKSSFLIAMLFSFFMVQVSLAQMKQMAGHFENIDIGNGVIRQTFVPDNPDDREFVDQLNLRLSNQLLQENGFEFLFQFTSASDLDPLTGNELAGDQKDGLQKVLDEYHSELKKLDSKLKDGKIKETEHQKLRRDNQVAYAKKVREILLPNQLKSIADNRYSGGKIFAFLTAEDTSQFVELSDEQRKSILEKCAKVNDEVTKMLETQKQLEEKIRKSTAEIYQSVLNDKQKEKVQTRLKFNPKMFFESLTLDGIATQTDLSK
ncbi:MAG: hypothetical protein ABL888_17655 [Pirellulaceae bacterium]